MITVVIEVKAPGWAALGIKENLAMYLERYGDARVVSVTETPAPPPPPTGGAR